MMEEEKVYFIIISIFKIRQVRAVKMSRLTIFLIIIIIIGILGADFTVALASENDDKTIFSFEKDGYWKPSDSISRDFNVKNIWGKVCYLDYITFKNTYIRDVETLKEYSVGEAINNGIINNYKVVISLNDANIGRDILFQGSIWDLIDAKIKLKNKIQMELDSVVTFNISITLDKLASNEYQNKSYEYIIEPLAYEVVTPDTGIRYAKDQRVLYLNKYIELQDGYKLAEDGFIYDKYGNRYTPLEYLDKIGLLGKFAFFIKTGDANMMLGIVTIILLMGSLIIMVKVGRRKG